MKIDEVVDILVRLNRTTPIGVTYLVEPRLLKTSNPFYHPETKSWDVEKLGELVGFTGGTYESIVNNQRAREGNETDFEAFPLWAGKGQHINKFVAFHPIFNRRYLKVMPTTVKLDEETYGVKAKVQYRWKLNSIPLNREELDKLVKFEVEKAVSERQENDKPVSWQTIGFDSILQLRFNKEIYDIEQIPAKT